VAGLIARRRTLALLAALVVVAAFALWGPVRDPDSASAAGCFPGRPHAPGTTIETIPSPQGQRSYRLYVPPSYNGADHVPLVLNLHGFTSNALEQDLYSELSERADEPDGGFVVVIPEGLPVGQPTSQHWNNVEFSGLQDDAAFLSDVLDEVEADLCIDSNRIFSTGMSNGAMMSVRLACSLSSRIAAIAPVAGSYYPQLSLDEPPGPFHNPSETCPDTRPVPVIAFHGTADGSVPFGGGSLGLITFRLPIDNTTPDDDAMQSWAAHNGCTSGRSESVVSPEVNLVTYTNCDEGADVLLYVVGGGGHTWPGAISVPGLGYTTQDISATDLMWEFFQQHPLDDTPPVDTDGDTIPDESDPDNDNDGCADANEAGLDPMQGGLRNSKDPWDFYDVLGMSGAPPDGVIDLANDVLGVITHYSPTGYTPGTPALIGTGVYDDFDRGPAGPGGWSSAPDGVIDLPNDILGVILQFGHSCV